jgi:DNA repair exonuclease SbcCD nuclease subunit
MKRLLIGDVHCKKNNIPDIQKLFDYIEKIATEQTCTNIAFTGDIFDSHAILSLHVIDFYRKTMARLCSLGFKVIVIAGNHDQIGDDGTEWNVTSLATLKGINGLELITTPTEIDGWAYIPYTHSLEKFKQAVNELAGCDVCVNHQTFDGAIYDNGMYAPDGFPVEIVKNFKEVIVGHVHTQMEFANIKYVGSPSWNTLSDANKQKDLWVHDGNTMIPFSMEGIVPKIVEIEITPDTENVQLDPFNKNYLILRGPSKWISKKAKEFEGYKIVPKPTDSKIVRSEVKISSFNDFLANYTNKDKNIDTQLILDYIGQLA